MTRQYKKLDWDLMLAIAKEIDQNGGDGKKVAAKHKVPSPTAESWYLRYKVYGESWFQTKVRTYPKGRASINKDFLARVEELERRVKRLEVNYTALPIDKRMGFTACEPFSVNGSDHAG